MSVEGNDLLKKLEKEKAISQDEEKALKQIFSRQPTNTVPADDLIGPKRKN